MKFHNIVFIIAIIVYSITAFYSIGYYHADEHYQIIEFAGILDGTNESKDMAWEYHEQIRSTIQPVIAFYIFRLCEFISITDPYSKAFILRLITAFLSLSVIYYFTNSCRNIVSPNYWKIFIILSYFLWFLPFLNVRFSSEIWAGNFLLLSISLILRNYRSISVYVLIGGLLGVSFLFRYQIAFSIVGLILWLLFIRKERIFYVGISTLAALLVVLLGIVIDSWYYNNKTITLLNYFIVNLIEGKVATFGTSPWYYYFFFIFRYPFFPIGIILLFSFVIITVKRYRSIIVWVILPFFIGHSFISHKELRFLFPLINLVPLLIITALDVISINKWRQVTKSITKAVLFVVLSINMFCLVIACIKPAGAGRIRITEKIHQLNKEEGMYIVYIQDDNPYSPWGITTNFYKENNVSFIKKDSFMDLNLKDINKRTVLIIKQSDSQDPQIKKIIKDMDLKKKCKSVPEFMIPLLKLYGSKTDDILIVYSNV